MAAVCSELTIGYLCNTNSSVPNDDGVCCVDGTCDLQENQCAAHGGYGEWGSNTASTTNIILSTLLVVWVMVSVAGMVFRAQYRRRQQAMQQLMAQWEYAAQRQEAMQLTEEQEEFERQIEMSQTHLHRLHLPHTPTASGSGSSSATTHDPASTTTPLSPSAAAFQPFTGSSFKLIHDKSQTEPSSNSNTQQSQPPSQREQKQDSVNQYEEKEEYEEEDDDDDDDEEEDEDYVDVSVNGINDAGDPSLPSGIYGRRGVAYTAVQGNAEPG